MKQKEADRSKSPAIQPEVVQTVMHHFINWYDTRCYQQQVDSFHEELVNLFQDLRDTKLVNDTLKSYDIKFYELGDGRIRASIRGL